MASILLLYSTTDGQTLAICRRLQSVLECAGHRVTLADVADAPDPAGFDKVVVGARIRYGRHAPQVLRFAQRHHAALDARPGAFFSVNAVARKPAKATPEANPYVRQFLARSPWRPKALAVFAGRIDYPRYGFVDRQVIRFIMWLTRGPTDPRQSVEFTDWAAVERFAAVVARM
jgi:menaquinone-dependent protoporphyrinogen oxidase